MENAEFWRGWREAQWRTPEKLVAGSYAAGRHEASVDIGGAFPGGGYQVVGRRELQEQMEVTKKIDALFARRESIKRIFRRDGERKGRPWRLDMVARYLAASYDVDRELCDRIAGFEAENTRRVTIRREIELVTDYADIFPRLGRFVGEHDAKERLAAQWDRWAVMPLRRVGGALRKLAEIRRERGVRAMRRAAREERVIRLSLAQAVSYAWESLNEGRRSRQALRDALATAKRYEAELLVVMGG